jgi:hypothetical protein
LGALIDGQRYVSAPKSLGFGGAARVAVGLEHGEHGRNGQGGNDEQQRRHGPDLRQVDRAEVVDVGAEL